MIRKRLAICIRVHLQLSRFRETTKLAQFLVA